MEMKILASCKGLQVWRRALITVTPWVAREPCLRTRLGENGHRGIALAKTVHQLPVAGMPCGDVAVGSGANPVRRTHREFSKKYYTRHK